MKYSLINANQNFFNFFALHSRELKYNYIKFFCFIDSNIFSFETKQFEKYNLNSFYKFK